MTADSFAFTPEQEELLTHLSQSRAQVLSLVRAGRLDQAGLFRVANREVDLTLLLSPVPLDPREHVLAAHASARPHLERLVQHDPGRLVVVDELHSYTPRKILRRVLDHTLDHLNQMEQWQTWQCDGIVPKPADGWATSEETFPEDLQPLSAAELQAWLWRIDLSVELVAARASQLSKEQLDWIPPDKGWTLRQVLSHLAEGEIFYAMWMDEALPEEPIARYSEANSRFEQQLRRVFALPREKARVLLDSEEGYAATTAEQVAQKVLTEERRLLV